MNLFTAHNNYDKYVQHNMVTYLKCCEFHLVYVVLFTIDCMDSNYIHHDLKMSLIDKSHLRT